MPNPETSLQTFLRFANLYGPQDDSAAYAGMPNDLASARPSAPTSAPRPSAADDNWWKSREPDEEMFAQQDQPQSAMEAFRNNVMNPPKRTQMTYPKSTLNGLNEALKIAAEPSPLEKNRVWVNGKAHQKQSVRTDPVTGEKQFVTNVHEPSFAHQVMRAMPASISATTDILNQPREDAVGDWELANKGLGAAAKAESEMALANQRNANAGYTGQRAGLEQQKIDVTKLTAEEKVRASRLNTLSDREKIKLLQEGRVSIEDLHNAAAMDRVEAQQTGANSRNAATITGAGERNTATIAGANSRNAATIAGANSRNTETVTGANSRNAATIAGAGERNTASIAGRAANGGSTSALPTQQKVAMQGKVAQIIADNPEYEDWISIGPNGFPQVTQPGGYGGPDLDTYNSIYYSIYGAQRGGTSNPPAAMNPPLKTQAPAATKPAATATKPATSTAASPKSGTVRVSDPDGRTGTWDYSKGPIPNGFKKIGG